MLARLDTCTLVLGCLRVTDLEVGELARVSSCFAASCADIRRAQPPMLARQALAAVFRRLDCMYDLASASEVCTSWRLASRAEWSARRLAVRRWLEAQQLTPRPPPLAHPLAEKVLLISERFGIEITATRGLTAVVHTAYTALGIDLAELSYAQQLALSPAVSLTLIQQLRAGDGAAYADAGDGTDGDVVVAIASFERLGAPMGALADALLLGLDIVQRGCEQHAAPAVGAEYIVEQHIY